ncbi:hypothetical protein LAUMK13_04175 [Mycobacterium innocens]|uniref:Uncharacterized protein n=1 Tax=Mycobacterium innocens TaxID=2341083 RepID=A0A498QB34_9MYCO|nr:MULTISPECIES: hypothetical protein [Mycobacterium]VBA42766.1 hypothetical protein LAUMK13_04175 [Mycobacterium innocens]
MANAALGADQMISSFVAALGGWPHTFWTSYLRVEIRSLMINPATSRPAAWADRAEAASIDGSLPTAALR